MPLPQLSGADFTKTCSQDDFFYAVGRHLAGLQQVLQKEHENCALGRDDALLFANRKLQEENQELCKRLDIPPSSMNCCEPEVKGPSRLIGLAHADLGPVLQSKKLFEPARAPQVDKTLVVPSRLVACDNDPVAEKEEDVMAAPLLTNVALNGDSRQVSIESKVEEVEDSLTLFEVWPEWQPDRKQTQADKYGSDLSRIGLIQSMSSDYNLSEGEIVVEPGEPGVYPKGVVSPSWSYLIIWNIVFMFVLGYELIILPMQAFAIPTEGVYKVVGVFCMLFWSLDLLLTMNTAYYTKTGDVVTSRRRILRKYAKGWLLPDVLLVSIDWLEFTNVTGGALKGGKAVRAFRVLRVMRILRMRKLKEVLVKFDEYINSQYFSIICSMVINVAAILLISHFLGCLWFVIGKVSIGGYPSWVKTYDFEDVDWEYQYLTSLHWSITQFTPGSMHVQPQNIAERAFAILVLVAGMIIFSSIVSSITAATNGLKGMNAKYTRQMTLFRRLCKEQGIRKDILIRITKFCEHFVMPRMNRVSFVEVELMHMLPMTFQLEVTLEIYGKNLTMHPMFRTLGESSCLADVCRCCLSEVILEQGDHLFAPGQQAVCMYFVAQGTLLYKACLGNPSAGSVETPGGSASMGSRPSWVASNFKLEVRSMEAKDWLGEAVMWTPWVFQGSMAATTEAVLTAVDSQRFRTCLATHRALFMVLKTYSAEFVRGMNELAGFFTDSKEDDCDLSDVLTIDSAIALLHSATGGSTMSMSKK